MNKAEQGDSAKTTAQKSTPTSVDTATTNKPSRLTRLKISFLYILIFGLGLAAITSVIALLVGEFNAIISKTLLSIFILFSHSLLLLGLLWVDTEDRIGKSVIATSIFAAVFASLITSTLGAWNVISSHAVGNWLNFYTLAIGGAFIISALLGMRLKQHAAYIATTTSIGFVIVTLLALTPWVFDIVRVFDPLYYRGIAALSILASASFLISLIFRGIAQSKHPELKKKQHAIIPNGLLAVYIIVGIATATSWMVGASVLIDGGAETTAPYSNYN